MGGGNSARAGLADVVLFAESRLDDLGGVGESLSRWGTSDIIFWLKMFKSGSCRVDCID